MAVTRVATPNHYVGVAADVKPTTDVPAGSLFFERDTGKTFIWDLTAWGVTSITARANTWSANQTYDDDVLLRLGADGDGVFVLDPDGVVANTAKANVLVGTVVGQALAANSVIFSNVTLNGDVAFYGNRGGNSEQWLFYDTSAGDLFLGGKGASGRVVVRIGSLLTGGRVLQRWEDSAATPALTLQVDSGGSALEMVVPAGLNNRLLLTVTESVRFSGGTRILSQSATPIGIQTTNTSLTVGSLGSIVLPVKTTTGEPTDAQIGNLSGSILWNEFDNTLNVRDTTVDNPLTVTLTGYLIQSYVPRERAVDAWYHPGQVWHGDVWGDGREVVDETRCPVCGEDIAPQAGPVVFWPNAYRSGSQRRPERLDVHAIFGHLHPEREAYIQQLEGRIEQLEAKAA